MTQKQITDMVVDRYKKGDKLRVIVASLAALGATTKSGTPLTTSHVSYIANEHGLRRHAKKVYGAKQPTAKDSFTTLEDIMTSNLSKESKKQLIRVIAKEL